LLSDEPEAIRQSHAIKHSTLGTCLAYSLS
jgi:hypothetical protein